MKISATVMAHPDRALAAKTLERQLSAMPFSDVYTIYDEISSEWDTGSRALKWGADKADWHIVIQDDALLTPDFYDNLVGCIESLPEKSLLSLYTGKVKPLADRVADAVAKAPDGSLLNFYMLLWGVGIALPSDHIEPLLDFVDDARYADTLYDTKIGIFYQRNRLPIYYSVPSLVDHNDDLGSLLEHGDEEQKRVAHRLATGCITWTGKITDI